MWYTAVNTGHINGVVVEIEQKMWQMNLALHKCIGCQHPILNRILKYVFNFYLERHTKSPNLNYKFINEVSEEYNILKESYIPEIEMPIVDKPECRDNFNFL